MARATNAALYGGHANFPVSGILMILNRGMPLTAFDVTIPDSTAPSGSAASIWAVLHD